MPACKKQVETNLPICRQEVAGSEAEEVASGEVPPDVWFAIMLRNFNRETMEVRRPVQDCSGRTVMASAPAPSETSTPAEGQEAQSVPACPVGDPEVAELPARPLTDDDLMITEAEGGKLLVWVKTTHFENTEAAGPLGLAEWTPRGVDIRALGTLRAFTERAAMRLEPMGQGKVLVVESRQCDPDDPKKCTRMMRLVPMTGMQFVDLPLVLQDGTCLGPAQIELHKEQKVSLDNGLERTFELARSVDFSEGTVTISEQVSIEDTDPNQPDLPAQQFRKANVQRPLTLTQSGLVTEPGLWERMLEEHGSVAVSEKPAQAEEQG